jgi:hypothetical protein
MTQEINLATHLGVFAILLDFPTTPNIENFARIIYQYVANVNNSAKFLFRIPISADPEEAEFIYR